MSQLQHEKYKPRRYGDATSIVTNMLLEIKEKNKDKDLADLIAKCCEISLGQKQFIDLCISPETDLQRKINDDTKNDERTSETLEMLTGHIEGAFLKLIAELIQAKNILEIGMYTGYGAVSLAESAHCVELVTLDVEPYYESFVKLRLADTHLEDKIRIMIGNAEDSLIQLKNEAKRFDLIFIDANKTGYLNYYKYIMENDLLTESGIILCDNILWYGKTFKQEGVHGKVLYEFVDYVRKDERVDQTILPIRDGILVVKPLRSWQD